MKIAAAVCLLALTSTLHAQSNISSIHKWAWGENIGWLNFRDAGSGAQGVVVADTYLGGYVWCENIGWLFLGDSSPANGIAYANVNGTDFGVNHNNVNGQLSGYAWSENCGWVNFSGGALATPANPARITTVEPRQFMGFAWGENIGWISFDDATHYVQVINCCPGNALNESPGIVDFADVTAVLFYWGSSYPGNTGPGDANCDGLVNFTDVTSVLANWLDNCP